jgi:hypothetical protein
MMRPHTTTLALALGMALGATPAAAQQLGIERPSEGSKATLELACQTPEAALELGATADRHPGRVLRTLRELMLSGACFMLPRVLMRPDDATAVAKVDEAEKTEVWSLRVGDRTLYVPVDRDPGT